MGERTSAERVAAELVEVAKKVELEIRVVEAARRLGKQTVDSLMRQRDELREELEKARERMRVDAEAAEWVSERGGIEAVRAAWENDMPLAEALISELWPDGRPCECDNAAVMSELRSRLMPEGMEWPRFEDGEPVRVGDSAPFGTDGVMEVAGVEINRFGYVLHGSIDDGMRECVDGDDHGVAVKRPAPKVLDADGEEIRAGDELWHVSGYGPRTVGKVKSDGSFCFAGCERAYKAEEFTHRAPVLAADGKPLREGETVWLTDGSERHVVLSTEKDSIGNIVTEVQAPGMVKVHISPSRLTHERPDSWGRLVDDISTGLMDTGETLRDCREEAKDFVRRAMALAERDS